MNNCKLSSFCRLKANIREEACFLYSNSFLFCFRIRVLRDMSTKLQNDTSGDNNYWMCDFQKRAAEQCGDLETSSARWTMLSVQLLCFDVLEDNCHFPELLIPGEPLQALLLISASWLVSINETSLLTSHWLVYLGEVLCLCCSLSSIRSKADYVLWPLNFQSCKKAQD